MQNTDADTSEILLILRMARAAKKPVYVVVEEELVRLRVDLRRHLAELQERRFSEPMAASRRQYCARLLRAQQRLEQLRGKYASWRAPEGAQ